MGYSSRVEPLPSMSKDCLLNLAQKKKTAEPYSIHNTQEICVGFIYLLSVGVGRGSVYISIPVQGRLEICLRLFLSINLYTVF